MRDDEGEPIAFAHLPGRRALLGERPEPMTVRYRHHGSMEDRWSRVQSKPVFDEDGNVRLAINVIEDITEIKRTEKGHRFLAEASRVLATSLDYDRTLSTVARLAVPEIADWCAVDLAVGDDVERVAVEHVDPARLALARDLERRYPADPRSDQGVQGVLRHGVAELYSEIPDEMLAQAARDPEHLELLRSVGMRSAMIVPMTARDRVLGAITFVSAESGRRFDEQDLALAMDLALRAAAAVENARLYEASAKIARTLQDSLLPPLLPDLPRMQIAAAYRPVGMGVDVGGDFYDVFSTAEDQWYAVIGDVCGKGAEAAAVTALARYTIRAAAVRRRSPAGDPALAERRDARPAGRGEPALLHDRVPSRRPRPPGAARDRRVRRPPAADRGAGRRRHRGDRDAGNADRARGGTRPAGPLVDAGCGRRGRPLHGRAHRGRCARAHLGPGRSGRGRGPGEGRHRRRARPAPASTRRSGRWRRSATTSRCWRCARTG